MKSTPVIAPLRTPAAAAAPTVAPTVPPGGGPAAIASASQGLRHVFVRDLLLVCSIGVYDHEKQAPQRVRINVDLGVREVPPAAVGDDIGQVVCYEQIVNRVRSITRDGHVNLVETMAERIAAICLQDPRVRSARVRVEKLDVITDAAAVGVEIERLSILP